MAMWGFFVILALFPGVMALGCIVGLAVLLYRALRMRKAVGPTCGKCGYAVQGLTQLRCPECGSSFLEAGIDTDKHRGIASPARFAVLWSFFLPMPALILGSLALAFGPQEEDRVLNVSLQPAAASYTINIGESGLGFWSGVTEDELSVHINASPQGTPATFAYYTIDREAGTFEDLGFSGGATPGPAPLDEAAVTAWLTNAGANAADPATQDEARELLRLLTQDDVSPEAMLQTTVFTVTDNSMTNEIPAKWFAVFVLFACILAWVLPPIFYWRLHTLRQRRWAEKIAAMPIEAPAASGDVNVEPVASSTA